MQNVVLLLINVCRLYSFYHTGAIIIIQGLYRKCYCGCYHGLQLVDVEGTLFKNKTVDIVVGLNLGRL